MPMQVELARLIRYERRALLPGKREAHHLLVERESHVDDLLDPKFQPAANVNLVGPFEFRTEPTNVLYLRHRHNPLAMDAR
jgi:hypothetical protein